ncbi:MAG: MFS transporter, partial [Pseudonocardiaceae bacterium]
MQPATNRLSPLRFVLAFGLVSCLADFVYEGARAIVGPFLATMGASALVVGFVTGFGEAVALVLRLGTGRLSDRTGRHWALSIIGYVVTVVAVPLLALAQTLWQAALLVVAERFGKAVRTPARDTMLAQASSKTGRGRAFALHEALDQSGAVLGPLVVAAMVALSGMRLGFGVLVVPGVAAVALLVWLRRAVPNPGAYEDSPPDTIAAPTDQRFSRRFWIYTAFTAMTMLGYATWGVLSYHLQVRQIVPTPLIPVLYAVAMG